MASYQVRQRDPLLDKNMQAMVERRGRELLGLMLISFGLALALMLGSYSPEDPGWMVASDAPAGNLLGRAGAGISSTLMIIGGYGSWGLPVVLLGWGARFVLHLGEDRAMGRLIFAVFAVALASVYAATHVPGQVWPHAFGLGGLLGDTVLGAVLGMAPVKATIGLKVVSLVLAIGLVALGLFVLGFDTSELRAIGRFLLVGLVVSYAGLLAALRLAALGGLKATLGLGAGLSGIAGGMATGAARARAAHAARSDARAAERDAAAMRMPAQGWPDDLPRGAAQAGSPRFQAPSPLGAGGARTQQRAAAAEQAPRSVTASEAGPRVRRAIDSDLVEAPDEMPAGPFMAADSARAVGPAPVRGLLARVPGLLRRAPDPEPELVERVPPAVSYDHLPSEDRIRARISDVIRAKARKTPALPSNTVGFAPPQPMRVEPPVVRGRRPQPLIADTARRPAAPPLAPQPTAHRAPVVASPLAPPEDSPLRAAGLPPRDLGHLAPDPAWESLTQDWRLADPVSDTTEHDAIDPVSVWDSGDYATADLTQDDDDREDDHAMADLPPSRPVVSAPLRGVAPEVRRVVHTGPSRAAAPSRQARAEAQPRLRFDDTPVPAYEPPPLNLLMNPSTITRHHLSDEALEENARMLENVLDDYGVKGEIVSVRPGPVVTMYELEPAPGLKASRVIGLSDDIARSMSALSARVSTVPGRSVIGIELPNLQREKVVLREILAARDFGDSNLRLPLALGKDIGGDPIVANLAKMPHLLIAGTTGSGKSVAINTMILSLLYKLTPEECRLIMIDPKMLELSVYDGIPHLLSPVVTDPKKAVVALKWVVGEMEERYRKMSRMGVRNIEGYNGRVREALARDEMFKRTIQTGFDDETGDPVFETEEFAPVALPYIVVIVDEMADLMMVAGKEIEACIQRLAQMARASGIHLIMATQRPSVDVITGTIKANFPTRISFQVTSKIDSRTILGEQGAEQLLGMGDMLYMAGGAKITRIHGPFVSDEEVEEIVNHLKSFGPPVYMSGVVEGVDEDRESDIDLVLGLGSGDGGEDALYDQAVAIVAKDRKCSTSYIQRKLGIGYNKAARLVEQMEEQGVVTGANHVGKREILVPEA